MFSLIAYKKTPLLFCLRLQMEIFACMACKKSSKRTQRLQHISTQSTMKVPTNAGIQMRQRWAISVNQTVWIARLWWLHVTLDLA